MIPHAKEFSKNVKLNKIKLHSFFFGKQLENSLGKKSLFKKSEKIE